MSRGATRRHFLGRLLRSGLALPVGGLLGRSLEADGRRWREPPRRLLLPDPASGWRGDSSVAAALRAGQRLPWSQGAPEPRATATPTRALLRRFADLKRHFVFEYYPWYGGPPDYVHWDYLDRHPPFDMAASSVPKLGPYDVRSRAALEQHARWITEAGAGAVALSWWGRGSWEDQSVPLILDVMRDHDLKVTFAMEPYAEDRGRRYAQDVLYLIREYGEKRGFDALLVLRNEDGSEGPVFKGFRCILPRETTDCHGKVELVSDYTPDAVWREQIDTLRNTLRADFAHVTLLADSLEFKRTPDSGFDGIGIYDNFIPPEDYAGYGTQASRAGLVFSFNINPGYDQIEPREVESGSCYAPRLFAPRTEAIDWSRAEERQRAARKSEERTRQSFLSTLEVQTDPALANRRRGFFLVYINSFNEWHEGHAFEPMRDAAELLPEERPFGYHNPARGDYRLRMLGSLLRPLLEPEEVLPPRKSPFTTAA